MISSTVPRIVLLTSLASMASLSAKVVTAAPVPAESLAEIAVIPVGEFPVSAALSADGSRLYVAEHFDSDGPNVVGNLSVIDTLTQSVVGIVSLGTGFLGRLRVTPDDSRAYVTVSRASGTVVSTGSSRVAVIDLDTFGAASIPAPPGSPFGPLGLDLLPDGTRGYVTDRGNHRVLIVDTHPMSASFHTILGELPVPGIPVGIGITPDGSRAYVASRATSEVSVIDTATSVVEATIPVVIGPSASITAVAVSPDGGRAYVTYATDSRIAVIDSDPASATYGSVEIVPTGGGPLGRIHFTPDGAQAFIAGLDGELLILDADPASERFHEVLARVTVGGFPIDVALQSTRAAVAYVPNATDGTVSVIGVSKGAVAELIANMDPAAFSNPNHQKTLLNKMSAVAQMIDGGELCAAVEKLSHDVLAKTDGAPAPADWLIDAEAQEQLRSVVEACIGQLLAAAPDACR